MVTHFMPELVRRVVAAAGGGPEKCTLEARQLSWLSDEALGYVEKARAHRIQWPDALPVDWTLAASTYYVSPPDGVDIPAWVLRPVDEDAGEENAAGEDVGRNDAVQAPGRAGGASGASA